MSKQPVIHWFRRDLRLADNTALNAALSSGQPVIPLFILDPALLGGERFSTRRLAFLLDGLQALDETLREAGGNLWLRHGEPLSVLTRMIAETQATALYFNADYSPYARKRDQNAQRLGITAHVYHDQLVHEPGSVLKSDDQPFVVFTPFYRRWQILPVGVPHTILPVGRLLKELEQKALPTLVDLDFEMQPAHLPAGEKAAMTRLRRFENDGLGRYAQARNFLDIDPFADDSAGTSGLSPYIRSGMISPRQLTEAAAGARAGLGDEAKKSVDSWLGELAWRDFYSHILYYFPFVLNSSFKQQYERVIFRQNGVELERWQQGMTGFPVIDAAMRQLNTLGWMHNRARMIVASFLTKDLLHYWREGETYFMRQLVDGDLASNNGGWQWAAGTGTDAQPYFRIFNPALQSKKFDPEGNYIRYWVPELRDLPERYIHQPELAPVMPRGYLPPMVDRAKAHARAIVAYKAALNTPG